jgi:DNA-binding beta-propeller fold protein YncE
MPKHNRRCDRTVVWLVGVAGAMVSLVLVAACTGASSKTVAPEGSAAPPRAGMTDTTPVGAAEAVSPTATVLTPSQATAVALATGRAAALMPSPDFDFGEPGIAPGQLMLPVDVGIDADGDIFVSDSKGVQRFDAQGTFRNLIGAEELAVALGIAVDADGTTYVTGMGPLVLVFDRDGRLLRQVGEEGAAPGQLQQPVDAALDAASNLYVVDARNYRVEVYSPGGEHLRSIGGRGDQRGQFESPRTIAVDGHGDIYVGMGDDFVIQRLANDGTYVDSFGKAYAEETMWRIGGLAVDDADHLYASRSIGHSIQAFDLGPTPTLRWEYGALGNGPGQFNAPSGLAYHAGKLYVADTTNNRIQVLRLP